MSIIGKVSVKIPSLTDLVGEIQEIDKLPEQSEQNRKGTNVSFVEDVRTILIPTADEYKQAGLYSLLWWDRFDYEMFKLGAMKEIDNFVQNTISTVNSSGIYLYNSNSKSSSDNQTTNSADNKEITDCDRNVRKIMQNLYQPASVDVNLPLPAVGNPYGVELSDDSIFEDIENNALKNPSINMNNNIATSTITTEVASQQFLEMATSPPMQESDIDKQLFVLD